MKLFLVLASLALASLAHAQEPTPVPLGNDGAATRTWTDTGQISLVCHDPDGNEANLDCTYRIERLDQNGDLMDAKTGSLKSSDAPNPIKIGARDLMGAIRSNVEGRMP